jgi:hypothetical protein
MLRADLVQVFVERFDENGNMYHWNGVKAGDIVRDSTVDKQLSTLTRSARWKSPSSA